MGRSERDEQIYDQEEEALLLDLSIKLNKEDSAKKPDRSIQTEDEFDFCSCASLASGLLPQMCAADEMFYRGQILPFRLSVSSENSSSLRDLSRNASRSDPTDDHSASSLGSSSSTIKLKSRGVQNVFYSPPSPKPLIRASTSRQVSFNGRTQKASTWGFFRLGLVRTPELEFQHLKNRISIHNRASIANNNGGKGNSSPRLKVDKRIGLLGSVSCKFSVETVPPKMPMNSSNNLNRGSNDCKSAAHANRKKVMHETKKKQMTQKKQAPSHHRTFEWLKDLSHASFTDDS